MADQMTIDMLINLLDEAELFPGEDGAVYARFNLNGERVTYPTPSPVFRMWLNRRAVETGLSMPGDRAIVQAVAEVEYKAHSVGYLHPVCGRFFSDANTIYINLATDQVLEISSSGHEIVDEHGLVFPTRAGALDLPVPEEGEALEILPTLLDLSERQTLFVLAWIMALLQPEGRIPVLIIMGPANSGKTRLAAAVRYLVDPVKAAILPLPQKPTELEKMAANNAVLAFDKVQALPRWLSHSLLALAEGTSMRNPETETTVQRKIPTILICDELSQVGELARDAIIVRLNERPLTKLQTKAVLERELRDGHPKALGAIADLAAKALACMPSAALTAVYKDAALEKWLVAVDTALDLKGKLLMAYRENGGQTLSDIVDDNPPVRAFLDLLHANRTVTATATDMLALTEPFLAQPKGARWPKSGKEFAAVLRRFAYAMTDVEIEFDVRTGKGRDRNIVATMKAGETAEVMAVKRPQRPKKATNTGDIEVQLSLI